MQQAASRLHPGLNATLQKRLFPSDADLEPSCFVPAKQRRREQQGAAFVRYGGRSSSDLEETLTTTPVFEMVMKVIEGQLSHDRAGTTKPQRVC